MLEDLIAERKRKLKKLEDNGMPPYPAKVNRTHQIADVLARFDQMADKQEAITVAGRVTACRDQGKLIFIDIRDESGKIQGILKDEKLSTFSLLHEVLDVGDFVELGGAAILTQRGERSIEASSMRIIAKSIRPLPDKWHGLADIEERLRRRYVDLIMNPETQELFRKKSRFWQAARDFMLSEGFIEVETPVLEAIPGGADAEPFRTHHNALDTDFYLRISMELHLKRLIVGGYEKIFEIGRVFRNEGIDREHLQDYSFMEFYWAYADYEMAMTLIHRLFQEIISKTLGTLKHVWQGQEIDWGGSWHRIDYYQIFKEKTGLDLSQATEDDLRDFAKTKGIETEKHPGRGRLIDVIFKKMVRPSLIQPGFLVLPPVDIEPLAKRWPNDPNRVERFQVVACGSELGKGFSELNDPVDQRSRFEEQMELRRRGDPEAQMMDDDYVEALEYGMPPTAGWGHSERLFSVLVDKPIRETTFFPLMRSRE